MQRIIENIQDLIRSICQPNPKKYPDPSIQQLILNRNIMNIWICTVFFLSYTIFSTFSKFSTTINLAIIVSSLFQLFSFIMLCRSYLWVFNILYVSVSFVLGSFALDMIQEATYFYIGHVFVLLFSILIRTGDTRLACFAGIVQIFTFLTKLKEKLIILVKEEEPEIFADKFVKITLFFFITMLLVNITLVKALDKRTLELSRAKHALENALDQQKTFIFSFSHELRNPINSLLGNLQLVLQGEVLSSKAAEMVGVAKVCGEILLHGINNVLDTGKHEIGKLEVNPVPTQLYELFQRTWGIYSELLRQKGLQSQLRIEKEMPAVVKIDSHKVNQILLNLIGNSIKFTKRGSITVTIKWLKCDEVCEKCFEPIPYDDVDEGVFEKEENLSTVNGSKYAEIKPRFLTLSNERRHFKHDKVFYPQEETKGVLKIIVKDTGSGMKKESLEKLFQKFSQVSENISQRQIGTGLGLFITKEICLAMNGEIRAYSKLGTGTTFIVCLPTVSVPLNTVQRADSEVIIKKLKERNLKALIADDSPFNVNLTSDYFSKFGGSVVSTAYNGYDAYMRYRECKRANVDIDLVILDIDMPTMDGRTVCDMIRRYEKENKLQPVMIILISGNYDKEQVNEYLGVKKGHRADEFIRKPVSSSEFNRAIYNTLTR